MARPKKIVQEETAHNEISREGVTEDQVQQEKNRNNKTERFWEPVCQCLKCGNKHLRMKRKKVKNPEPNVLCIYVCPKCKSPSYIWIGDQLCRRKINKDVVDSTL